MDWDDVSFLEKESGSRGRKDSEKVLQGLG